MNLEQLNILGTKYNDVSSNQAQNQLNAKAIGTQTYLKEEAVSKTDFIKKLTSI